MSDSDLVFPLPWSNFCVDTCDLDSCSQTASNVCFSNCSSETIEISYWTVVRTLRLRITSLRPAQRPCMSSASSREQEIFLFNSEPGFFVGCFLHNLVSDSSEIASSWSGSISKISFAECQPCGDSLSEGVLAHENRLEPNFRITSHGLPTRWTIICPPIKFFKLSDFSFVDLGLWTKVLASAIDPNVFD